MGWRHRSRESGRLHCVTPRCTSLVHTSQENIVTLAGPWPLERDPGAMIRIPLLLLLILGVACPAVEYDEAHHPDGSLHYKIKLDREGRRDGKYVRHHPAGEDGAKGPKAEVGTYRDGQLHGVVTQLGPQGEILAESQWVAGVEMLPLTERFIEYRLKAIEAAAQEAVSALGEAEGPRPDAKTLAAVLARTNHYRLLCGLDPDVVLDAGFIHEAQCAAEVCASMGKLDHHPKKNPGLAEARWQAGKRGCAKSNLAMGSTGPASIDSWIDDSDQSNRDRVGHRRWLLWPELERMGYGESGRFAAGHVIDGGGGSSDADVPFVAFPPRGLMPLELFAPHYCWHASPDPERYTVGKDARLEIRPYDPRSGETGEAIPLQFQNVDTQGFGKRPAVISQPEQFALKRGAMYQVTVTGVTKKQADAPDIRWVTVFY